MWQALNASISQDFLPPHFLSLVGLASILRGFFYSVGWTLRKEPRKRMVTIKLTRQEAEDLLEVYEQEGSNQEIVQELKISLGMIKPVVIDGEKHLIKLDELWRAASVMGASHG